MLEQVNLLERYERIKKKDELEKLKLSKRIESDNNKIKWFEQKEIERLKAINKSLHPKIIKPKIIKIDVIKKPKIVKIKYVDDSKNLIKLKAERKQLIIDSNTIFMNLFFKTKFNKIKLFNRNDNSLNSDCLIEKEIENLIKYLQIHAKPIIKIVSNYTEYKNNVLNLTSKTKNKFFKNINKQGCELDHKISIWFGFHNNIEPILIANYKNLQYIPKQENRFKSYYSVIDFNNKFIIENITIHSDFLNTVLNENYDRTIDYSLTVHKFKKAIPYKKK